MAAPLRRNSAIGRAGEWASGYTGDGNGHGDMFEGSNEVWSGYFFLGAQPVTSNVAEYCGLIEGLQQGAAMNIPSLLVQGDSQLVIRQLTGEYKVRNSGLKLLHAKALQLAALIPVVKFAHIPRELNRRADALANQAMDCQGSGVSSHHSSTSPDGATVCVDGEANFGLKAFSRLHDLVKFCVF